MTVKAVVPYCGPKKGIVVSTVLTERKFVHLCRMGKEGVVDRWKCLSLPKYRCKEHLLKSRQPFLSYLRTGEKVLCEETTSGGKIEFNH